MAFLKFYIDQFVSTYDYIRPLTRLRDLISTSSEMCCNDTIQFSIDMHFICKYGRTNEYLPVCIFMFIHLIVILSMLNNIESHNVINNNLWNRYDVGSAPIVLAHHRTIYHAYLCHAIVSRMTSFASCTKWQTWICTANNALVYKPIVAIWDIVWIWNSVCKTFIIWAIRLRNLKAGNPLPCWWLTET